MDAAIQNHSEEPKTPEMCGTPEVTLQVPVNPFECSKEEKLRRLEAARIARSNSTKKGVYSRAIALHCRACKGPTFNDCENPDCSFYDVRRIELRQKKRKKDLRITIRDECRRCVGSHDDLCQSPDCNLYHLRFGAKRPL